jgi:hypothetical protein
MSDESTFLSVIRVWAALAWADDVIAEPEAEAMKRLIAGADLTDDERKEALGFLDNKVDLETANVEGLSDKVKQGIYRAAYRLAKVDLNIADEERSFLKRLRDGLSLSEDMCKDIESSIDASS